MKKENYYKEQCKCGRCYPEGGALWICSKWTTGIKTKALIGIHQTKKEFKKTYTLRARIGIYIGVLIGLIELDLKQ